MPNRTLLFPLHGFVDWNGGLDLARVLSTALLHPGVATKFDIRFAFPEPSARQRFLSSALRFWRLRLVRSGGGPDAGSPASLQKAAREIAAGQAIIPCPASAKGILAAASQSGADIVFPTMFPLGTASVPRVGYLFDFQHFHMPELFPERTRRNRDARFARLAGDADAIIVNARATANDAVAFLGMSPDRILTIPYTPHALPWWFDSNTEAARTRHGVGERYLMVCNHFWKHKDHATALRAFAAIRGSLSGFEDLQLILTGDPVDHRDPRHYVHLRELCDGLGISGKVLFLGLIPKRDQLALLRGCMALLQPTLFEGGPGGGSVYEAIGLGIPAIASDIPVNLEIDQGNVRFFRAGDADDMANKIAELLSEPPQRPSREALLAAGDANLARLGNAIADFLAQVGRR